MDEDKARAERERVANEEKARESKAEADRAESLKAEIAQLEQQAAQAKASAQAEMQKAEEAKKASAETAKVASIAPAAASAETAGPSSEQRALAASIETELRRIGCYAGADRDWDAPSVRLGVAEYARYAKLAATPTSPDAALLDSLKGLHERVCPLECAPRETAVNGRCVAKGCPRGEILSRDGRCVARQAPLRATASREIGKGARPDRLAEPLLQLQWGAILRMSGLSRALWFAAVAGLGSRLARAPSPANTPARFPWRCCARAAPRTSPSPSSRAAGAG